ncbi:MAG: hypothetical protein M1376_03515 [Planctomycetes bacterium]|nr:hypothetical protein [Planctomycetota bacterium]
MEKRKTSRRKKLLVWLAVDLVVAAVMILLFLHKPSQYHPAAPADPNPDGQQVDPYLHRDLSSKFYNGAQNQQPFEMVVLDQALNEALGRLNWSQESGGVKLSAPQVFFTPGRIVLMGTTTVEGQELVITVELKPQMDDQGNLTLLLDKVKVGAIPVTLIVKPIAKKMYRERVESLPIDREDWRTKAVASLFNDEPFEPVLRVEDKWVRLQSFDLADGKLTARFVPVKPKPKPKP